MPLTKLAKSIILGTTKVQVFESKKPGEGGGLTASSGTPVRGEFKDLPAATGSIGGSE